MNYVQKRNLAIVMAILFAAGIAGYWGVWHKGPIPVAKAVTLNMKPVMDEWKAPLWPTDKANRLWDVLLCIGMFPAVALVFNKRIQGHHGVRDFALGWMLVGIGAGVLGYYANSQSHPYPCWYIIGGMLIMFIMAGFCTNNRHSIIVALSATTGFALGIGLMFGVIAGTGVWIVTIPVAVLVTLVTNFVQNKIGSL